LNDGIALIFGCIIIGIFIGIVIANTANSFSVEITPNNTLRAAVEFT